MTHFSLLVVGTDVCKQLYPFGSIEKVSGDFPGIQEKDLTEDYKRYYVDYLKDHQSGKPPVGFLEFVNDDYKATVIGEVDVNGDHKDGYTLVDENKNVLKVVLRFNPNTKWDWYEIGGRFNGFLKLKNGNRSNVSLKKDVDVEAMWSEGYFATYAILYNGVWVRRRDECSDEEWNNEFNGIYNSIPDHELLTVVDCHF